MPCSSGWKYAERLNPTAFNSRETGSRDEATRLVRPPCFWALWVSWTIFQKELNHLCCAAASQSLGCLLALCILDQTSPFRRDAASSLSVAHPLPAPPCSTALGSSVSQHSVSIRDCLCMFTAGLRLPRQKAHSTKAELPSACAHASGQRLGLPRGWSGSRMGSPY